jgi:hypothetical protein
MDSNYVGFTATPYANIFINPDTDEDMVAADLFPKDFIYVLPTPAPYIGAQIIFGQSSTERPNYGDCSYMLDNSYITDIKEPSASDIRNMSEQQQIEGPIYFKHKKTWRGQLPLSLIEAVRCFYLANAIRDLDIKQQSAPRTMLVNISRFVGVHSYLKCEINQLVTDDFKEMRINFSTDQSRNVNNELYKELFRLYNLHYSNCGYTWEQVGAKDNLLRGGVPRAIVVNGSRESREDTPDYKRNPSLRIIAVGGLALSRGLTLKGLSTSYFYRNTCTYDVLMQMGRWFGYRTNYEKVCRIWITNTSANWYREIAEATEELKSELAQMQSLELTPTDFGLRIRRDDTALEITARNKMRKAGKLEIRTTFWGDVFETPYFSTDVKDNFNNIDITTNWLSQLVENNIEPKKVNGFSSYIMKDVPADEIVSFLRGIKTSNKNLRFNRTNIADFIIANKVELGEWDVIIVGGTSDVVNGLLPNTDLTLKASTRKLSVRGDGEGFSFTHQGVVSGNNDGKIGLVDPHAVQEEYRLKESKINPLSANKINRYTWFKYANRKPALFIYPVRPSDKTNVEGALGDYINELGEKPIMGYSVGIPGYGHESNTKSYYTNVVYQNNEGLLESEEDE